jgi:hypothetical protein
MTQQQEQAEDNQYPCPRFQQLRKQNALDS